MTKRAAMVISGGLIAALMAGVLALWLGRGVVGASAASSARPTPHAIVKVKTRVITVHKQRPAKASAPQRTITVVRQAPNTASSGSGGQYSEHEQEHDGHSDGAGGDD